MASIGFTPSGPVVAEDVRNLQNWVERRSRFGSLASCSRISVRTSTQSPSFGVG